MKIKTFKTEVEKLFKNIDPNWIEKIEKYREFLQEYNKSVNLTRLDSDEKIYKDYFYESIVPYRTINFKDVKNILDIGSGSGIPGVVLKILFPNIALTIIESNTKKVIFLQKLIRILELENVVILNKRAEELEPKEYESFDFVTSRAVAPLSQILELSIPYAKIGAWVVEPKSTKIDEELKNITSTLDKLNSKIVKIDSFISVNGNTHNVVFVKKTSRTSNEYPRKWGKIISEPL